MANKSNARLADELNYSKLNLQNLIDEKETLSGILNINDRIEKQNEIAAEKAKLINLLLSDKYRLIKEGKTILDAEVITLNNQIEKYRSEVNLHEKTLKLEKQHKELLDKKKVIYKQIFGFLDAGLKSLNTQDKIIRQTILNLGMSGQKADMMRKSFESAAADVAILGGNLADIQKIQEGFADETGRVRTMTAKMLTDVAEIGYGTGIGIENATKMAAQFEIMGIDAARTKNLSQMMVDNGEHFGISSKNALMKLITNFSRLNTFTFQGGSKSMANMAMYSEQMKVNMEATLNSAETARTLEGAIDLAAQLQIMGGEFSKSDPFELLYLSRNDPEKYAMKISEMTKSVVTFKKNGSGIFEKFISPADIDRLTQAGKALGFSKEQMVEMAQRSADMDAMGSQLMGSGLTTKQKELIKGAAIFNSSTGKFEVKLGEQAKAISELTQNDLSLYEKQQSSLKDRAIAAQDFDTAMTQMVEGLKATLLPILRGVNDVLSWIRTPFESLIKIIDGFTKKDIGYYLLRGAGILLASTVLIGKLIMPLIGAFKGAQVMGAAKGKQPRVPKGQPGAGQFMSGKYAGQGMKNAGIGAGVAALGIGAGIGLAAAGVSLLADSMAKLDDKKALILKDIVSQLGWFVVGGAAISMAIMAFSKAGAASAPAMFGFALGLGAVGLGLATVGLGVASIALPIAAVIASIGYLVNSFANLGTGFGTAMSSITNLKIDPVAISSLQSIANVSGNFDVIGNAFQKIGSVLSGNKDDFIAIENAVRAISTMQVSKDSAISQLSNLFNKTLKVEFADKNLTIANNITLDIDGEKFVRKVITQKAIVQIMKDNGIH